MADAAWLIAANQDSVIDDAYAGIAGVNNDSSVLNKQNGLSIAFTASDQVSHLSFKVVNNFEKILSRLSVFSAILLKINKKKVVLFWKAYPLSSVVHRGVEWILFVSC